MPIFYMTFWSLVMIIALSIGRLQSWSQRLSVALVTLFVLLLSQSLFVQLAVAAGLDPSSALVAPERYLMAGPLGWLAILVMPCGWLGPFVGVSFIQRWQNMEARS